MKGFVILKFEFWVFSMITTSGTIANTGPPPTCRMQIVDQSGQDINSAALGENLMLKIEVEPKNVYGGFARSCIAKTTDENNMENRYVVSDDAGCAVDPSVFGEWEYDRDGHFLYANFNAFKFPNGNTIRFECNVRVCFGHCQPVNCKGIDAYGRRRRRRRQVGGEFTGFEFTVGPSTNVTDPTAREEITTNSNAIIVTDRRDQQQQQTTQPNGDNRGESRRQEHVCVDKTLFIVSLVITALLALVAVAVAVSCWLMAYRRRPKADGPLPHPTDFPNPLYTTPEPISEPIPDYLS